MAFTGTFRSPVVKGMARDVQGYKLQDLLGLISGKKSPWESPTWKPLVEGMRTQGDLGLGEMSKRLTEGGVTGPAAGLSLERAGEGINNNILNLANSMKSGMDQEAWKSGDLWTKLKKMQQDYAISQQQQNTGGGAIPDMGSLLGVLGKLIPGLGGAGAGLETGLSGALAGSWGGLPPELLAMLAI